MDSASADQESQNDEMMALESILDSKCFKIFPGPIPSGQIDVEVSIPDKFSIVMSVQDKVAHVEQLNDNLGDGTELLTSSSVADENRTMRVDIKHLPPLVLHFTLPENYPSEAKPTIILSSKWLDRRSISVLCRKLDDLWEENKGMAILFLWYSTLREETFSLLNIQEVYDISWWLQIGNKPVGENVNIGSPEEKPRIKTSKSVQKIVASSRASPSTESQQSSTSSNGHDSLNRSQRSRRNSGRRSLKISALDKRAVFDGRQKDSSLWDFLLSHDQEERTKEFQTRSHSCDICLMEKMGTDCFQFSCEHVFCKDCVTEYFSTHIQEGSIASLKCPDVKCKTVPTHAQVRMAVSEELFIRYDELLLKRTLESMPDILYCPRPMCDSPVIADPNDKLAYCNKCNYTFCSICRMVFHGVEPCRFRTNDKKEVYQNYVTGSDDDKKKLELTYGKKQLNLLIQTVMSEEWVSCRSKPCPHCSVPIEKFEGCNKVTCFKCNTYFCWICSAHLDHGNPYFHFNDPNSKCYSQLFYNVEDEDDDDDDDDDGLWGADLGTDDSSDDDLLL